MSSSAVPVSRAPSRYRAPARVVLLPLLIFLLLTILLTALPGGAAAQSSSVRKWVSSWTTSPQGPYPVGFAVAQPDLSFALPTGATDGAVDQTFRLIVKPDLWSNKFRLRFSNLVGTQPVTLGRVAVGVQTTGGNLLADTNRPVTFNGGQTSVRLPVGQETYSDAFKLPTFAGDPATAGRSLAVASTPSGPPDR